MGPWQQVPSQLHMILYIQKLVAGDAIYTELKDGTFTADRQAAIKQLNAAAKAHVMHAM